MESEHSLREDSPTQRLKSNGQKMKSHQMPLRQDTRMQKQRIDLKIKGTKLG